MQFDTAQYVRSHGKPPKGRGSWAFEFDTWIDSEGVDHFEAHFETAEPETVLVFSPGSMLLTEAKAWFKREHGKRVAPSTYVEVMP